MLQQSVLAEAHLWCEVTHSVRESKPHQGILSYAAEREVDLICIGTHGQSFRMGTLFASNVDRVLREARCPVLMVRPAGHSRAPHHMPN